jgi:lipoprotein-anchoring transpeptidase ErfK/SrfK
MIGKFKIKLILTCLAILLFPGWSDAGDLEKNRLYQELQQAGFTIVGAGEKYQVPYVEILMPEGMAVYSLCRRVPSLNERYLEARERIAYFNAVNPFYYRSRAAQPNRMSLETLKIPLELTREPEIFPAFNQELSHHERYILINIGKGYLALYGHGELLRVYPISPGAQSGFRSRTPLMNFTVQLKKENHWSTIYDTWMPWSLLISRPYYIHGGALPGVADSAGCIRMFNKDARELYELVQVGTPGSIVFSPPQMAMAQQR